MSRFTSVYSEFLSRLDEVETLRRSAARMERKAGPRLGNEIRAQCRGAIVLLSGHLEAFIEELGELALDSLYERQVPRDHIAAAFFYHCSKGIIEEIRGTSDHEKIASKVFAFVQDDAPFWCRTGPFPQPISVERFNAGFSNPKVKKVAAYFNRFGYRAYNGDLKRALQAEYQPVVAAVDHLVDVRNDIAHGDWNATETPADLKAIMLMVRRYCAVTDGAFATWWKSQFCAIR
jgi:hypothetical protein